MAKLPRAKLTKLLLCELAAVPMGAQSVQGTVVLKSAAPGAKPMSSTKKRSAITTAVMGHTHLIGGIDDMQSGCTSSERTYEAGVHSDSYYAYHSHPWVRAEDGSILLGEAAGHTHEIAQAAASLEKSAANKSTHSSTPTKVEPMKLVILTEAQKAYYDKLSSADAETFIAKSHSDREVDLQKAAAADPEVYKTDSGVVIRKSHGDVALMLAKQADEAMRQVAKANELANTEKSARELTELKKRAKETIGNLAGSDEAHCAILKAAESIADEKLREEAITALKAANGLMVAKAKAPGVGGELEAVAKSAVEQLDTLTEKYAAEKNVDRPTARVAVMKTADGKRLYAESIGR